MIICVVGPTGVGKTKMSIMLAKEYNGIIVNADACQVYKELNIGTAKIKEEEKEGIKHILFDIKNPNEYYSVSDYQNDLRKVLEDNKGKNIIIVGGTGLYLTAGLYDYEFSPMKDNDYSNYTNEELYDMCKRIDSNIDIHLNNRRRLENYLKRENKSTKEPVLLYNDVYFVGLTTDRDNLYNIINKRVDIMLEKGLIYEVKSLYKKYPQARILKSAIGYKEIINYIDGNISLEEAIDEIKKNSRHYAKRQYTWFNNKMNVEWFRVDFNNFSNTYKKVKDYLDNSK
jgi:tRNA dimethylallyltransferase